MSSSVEMVFNDGFLAIGRGLFIRGNTEIDWIVDNQLALMLPVLFYTVPVDGLDALKNNIMLSAGLKYAL